MARFLQLFVCALFLLNLPCRGGNVEFVQNKGQWENFIHYRADFNGGRVFLENNQISYLFYGQEKDDVHHHAIESLHSVKVNFLKANNPQINAAEESQSYCNFFIGNDPSKWVGNVRKYGSIRYADLYTGIDLVVDSRQSNLKYDYIIAPGADPLKIKLQYSGVDRMYIKDGALHYDISVGTVLEQKPYAYQIINGEKKEVVCDYTLQNNVVGFKIGKYNKAYELVIDPLLVFSTFTGASPDNWGMTATYDSYGNAYGGGMCFNTGYVVTTGVVQTGFGGGGTVGAGLPNDMVITKFDATGAAIIYSTYLGGADNEQPQSLVVDDNDNLLLFGRTYSSNFPNTAGSYDNSYNGNGDIVVVKLNNTGTSLLASTFIGGTGMDGVNITPTEGTLSSLKYNYSDDARGEIICDEFGDVYVASCTQSGDFPVTAGAYKIALSGTQDGCVFKLNSSLSNLTWSTYLGGNLNDAAYSICLDTLKNTYVTGGTESSDFPSTSGAYHTSFMGGSSDGFVSLVKNDGTGLLASTFIGTSQYDQSYFVQHDGSNIYLFGQTAGQYPVSAGVYSNANSGQFIQKLDPALSTNILSTVFGSGRGTPDISPSAFMVDECGNIYTSGWGGTLYGYNVPTSSTSGMPLTSNAFQSSTDGSDFYFLVLEQNASSLWYASYFGGATSLEHVDGGTSRFDKSGYIYQAICAGCGNNSDMPTTPGAWSTINGSANCNMAVVKFQFELVNTSANFASSSFPYEGCAPLNVAFENNSDNGDSFYWFFGDGDTSTQVEPTHLYSNPGTYTVMLVVENLQSCNIRDTAYGMVYVYPPFIIDLIPDTFICKGDSIQLTTDTSYVSYQWFPSTGLSSDTVASPYATPVSDMSYVVQVSDGNCMMYDTVAISLTENSAIILAPANTMCDGYTMALQVPGAQESFLWSTGDTAYAISIDDAGTYYVTAIDSNGCAAQDSITITLVPNVDVFAGNDTILCPGQTMILSGQSSGNVFVWEPAWAVSDPAILNPGLLLTEAGQLILQSTNGACNNSDTINISFANPSISITADGPLSFCSGDSVVLIASPGNSNYQWTGGELNDSLKVYEAGIYTVNALSAESCPVIASAQVNVIDVDVDVAETDTVCIGYPLTIETTGNAQHYVWTPVEGLSDPFVPAPQVISATSGMYYVTATTANCIDKDSIFIHAVPSPTLIVGEGGKIYSGQSITLDAVTDGSITWFPQTWLSCDDCADPVAAPDSSMWYYITVENELGCAVTDSLYIEVEKIATFYIPNCFTPGNDGLNEEFKVYGINIKEVEMQIFDRWGKLIFVSNEVGKGWDGKYKGSVVQQDVYVYTVKIRDELNKRYSLQGSVTVLK